jgi:hypothetical protein
MRQIARRPGWGWQVALHTLCKCALGPLTVGLLIDGSATVPALSQSFVETYATLRACEGGGRLSDAECHNAFANAQAEFDEETPRFPRRPDCESVFHHCMIAGFGPAAGKKPAAIFEPTMRAVELHLRSSSDRTVVPLLDGDASGLTFEPRTILRPDTGVSASHRAQVQAAWQARQTATPNGTAAGPAPDAFVPPPHLPKPADQAPPPSPAATAQRRQELQTLPFVP